jgi:hypothetical protein
VYEKIPSYSTLYNHGVFLYKNERLEDALDQFLKISAMDSAPDTKHEQLRLLAQVNVALIYE